VEGDSMFSMRQAGGFRDKNPSWTRYHVIVGRARAESSADAIPTREAVLGAS